MGVSQNESRVNLFTMPSQRNVTGRNSNTQRKSPMFAEVTVGRKETKGSSRRLVRGGIRIPADAIWQYTFARRKSPHVDASYCSHLIVAISL